MPFGYEVPADAKRQELRVQEEGLCPTGVKPSGREADIRHDKKE